MQIGFNLPLSGALASPPVLTRLAVEGEAIGFDYIALSDHIVEPTHIHARYPYSETGEFPKGSRGERHEQLSAMAYLAAKTSRIRFLTSVMVVPHRPAVLAAKILSTIDVMSGGRVIVGVGAGWLEEEFEALGAPPFAERGRVTDEYLQAFRALWTDRHQSAASAQHPAALPRRGRTAAQAHPGRRTRSYAHRARLSGPSPRRRGIRQGRRRRKTSVFRQRRGNRRGFARHARTGGCGRRLQLPRADGGRHAGSDAAVSRRGVGKSPMKGRQPRTSASGTPAAAPAFSGRPAVDHDVRMRPRRERKRGAACQKFEPTISWSRRSRSSSPSRTSRPKPSR